jgi:hypothetical protein
MKSLVIPPAAQRDENAVQMLSAWIAERGLHCALNVGMWREQGMDEPAAWGTLLADVVRHIANALHEEARMDRAAAVSAVLRRLLDELDEPTSDAEGGFHPGPH